MKWDPMPDLYAPYLRTRIRKGRGVGEGAQYAPWLRVRDVPSRGTSSSVTGIVVGRAFQLLSELEATYFFLCEREQNTVDLREQWPILEIDETLQLSKQLGVRHPYRRGYPDPFTIDFIITSDTVDGRQYRAASIKSKDEAKNPAVRQRLAVEYLWCRAHGIPWTLVDTSHFNKILLGNLRFLRSWFRHRYEPDPALTIRFVETFLKIYRRNVPLEALIVSMEKSLRISESTALDTFRYCSWRKEIPIALSRRVALNLPLTLRGTGVFA
ncbi:hypothetical protein R8510_05349 [Ralstonia chuxiongensis]|nr:hypothetical protein R8510_05349 [Ralstonia chuxiongensis]